MSEAKANHNQIITKEKSGSNVAVIPRSTIKVVKDAELIDLTNNDDTDTHNPNEHSNTNNNALGAKDSNSEKKSEQKVSIVHKV